MHTGIEPRCAPELYGLTYVHTKKTKSPPACLPPEACCDVPMATAWHRLKEKLGCAKKVCVLRDYYGSTLSELISKDWFDMLESICMNMEGFAWRIRIRYKVLFFFFFFYKDVKDNNDRHARVWRRPCARSPISNPMARYEPSKFMSSAIQIQDSDGDQGER